ncbi:MAG: type IA DNA topoisomerase, partial [Lachnospiraceae bacterium]|nr:type IA DNA topoisomerase [Lachnospiraceae bacterium]
ENAGQLIEDEDLRAQIKGSGIGTSATRAEILQKLFKIHYLKLNNKTQIIMPEFLGELVYETVNGSIAQLLNPELTASWEKGLTYVAEGEISPDDYMVKLRGFIERRTDKVRQNNNLNMIRHNYQIVRKYY